MKALSHPAARSLIRAHFALRIAPTDERRLRLHLSDCPACHAQYERHRMLAELDPSAPTYEQRVAKGLGLAVANERTSRAPMFWSLAAAALALCVLVPARAYLSPSYSARGTTPVAAQVLVYKVEPGHSAKAAGDSVRATDELAFAYTNPNGFRKLMIFGIDEHRHVYWYHPAWLRAEDNPQAIDIVAGTEVRELPEAIHHSFDGHQLTICSIFSNEELSVKAVEQSIKDDAKSGCPSGMAHSLETTLKVE